MPYMKSTQLLEDTRMICLMANEWREMETVKDFIFLGSKIIVDGDWSPEIKKKILALWKKSYDKPKVKVKVLVTQSCSAVCDPMDCSPPASCPWNSPGKNTGVSLNSILKSRDITLLTKVHLVKAMVFPVVIYWCESWSIKKAEHQTTDTF